MQIINKRLSCQSQRSSYTEDFDNYKFSTRSYNDFIPDDDVPTLKEDPKVDNYKTQSSLKGNISEQLQRIEEKIAKLEGMLQELLSRNSQAPVLPSNQPYQPSMMAESIQTPAMQPAPKGSMLEEIQSVIAQQEAISGSMGQVGNGDVVSSIATLSPAAYDDDVPNIIGLD